MLKLRDRRAGYTHYEYICPETGKKVFARNISGLIVRTEKHRKQNNLPMPLNFWETWEHNWCVEHPEMCVDPDAPKEVKKCCGNQEPIAYPSLKDQLKDLWKTSKEFINSGGKRSDWPLVQSRLEKCIQCEFWNGGKSFLNFRCRKCGCRMRVKVRLKSAKCPAGKW